MKYLTMNSGPNRQQRRAAYKQAVDKRKKSENQKRMDRPDRSEKIDMGYRLMTGMSDRAIKRAS